MLKAVIDDIIPFLTFLLMAYIINTGQCKRTGGCYNELVVAFFSIGGGVKGKKNLYLLTLWFIYKTCIYFNGGDNLRTDHR